MIRASVGDIPILSSYLWREEPSPGVTRADVTLADVLARIGFGDPDGLESGVAAWDAVLQVTQPDLIVADFAPALRVASAGRVPCVVTGGGYAIPPPDMRLPSIRQDAGVNLESEQHEAAILTAANGVRHRRGLSGFATASEILRGDRTYVRTYACLDPYRSLRNEPSLGPINIPAMPIGPPIGNRTGPHVFCYVDASAGLVNPLLTALNGLAVPSQIYVRGLDPHEVARHCAPQVGIHQGHADFLPLVPQTRLIVHHGGLGTTSAALLAGTPQLLMPRHLEQVITAEAIAPFGTSVALTVAPDADALALRRVIEQLLAHHALHDNAIRQAHAMRDESHPDRVRLIVEGCENLLASSRPHV